MGADIRIDTVSCWIRQFVQSPEIAGPMALLRRILSEKAQLFIVGGALRNRIIEKIHGNAPVTRDVDIFIGGVGAEFPLQRMFAGYRFESTELGGIRWYPQHTSYSFDICLIPCFIVLKKYGLPDDIQTLLTVLDFDVNAVIYDPGQDVLHENRCVAAITRKTMDFNTRLFWDKDLLIYRILVIRHKIDFSISAPVFHFLKSSVDMAAIHHVRSILVSKIGRSDARDILGTFDRICGMPDYESYLKAQKAS